MFDKVGGRIDHAGDQNFIVRNTVELFGEGLKIMLVARVAGLEQQPGGLGLHQGGQDCCHFDIAVVWAFIIAPADVHPDPVCCDIAQCMIEHRDMLADKQQIIGIAAILVHHMAAQTEVGAIELQDQARADNCLIFGPHRLSQSLKIVVLRGVVLIGLKQRDDPWRGRIHETTVRLVRRQCGLQMRQVFRQRRQCFGRDWPDAFGAAIGRRATAFALPAHERGKCLKIGWRRALTIPIEAGDPVLDIGCIADLRHLTIRDQINPRFDLARHCIAHRSANHRIELGGINCFAAFLSEHEIGHGGRARQRTDVSGQYSISHAITFMAATGRYRP